MTLRFLLTGTTFSNMQFGMKASPQAIGKHVLEVCLAIWQEYYKETLKFPDRKGWQKKIDGFEKRWNIPNCFGAIDGKHVRIKKPNKAGSDYFNYKRYSSLVLMALVDYEYKFIWVDIGYNGGSNSQIWKHVLNWIKELKPETWTYHPKKPLPEDNEISPYFIVGDDAFALRSYLQKPFRHPVGNAQRSTTITSHVVVSSLRTLLVYSPKDWDVSSPLCNYDHKTSKSSSTHPLFFTTSSEFATQSYPNIQLMKRMPPTSSFPVGGETRVRCCRWTQGTQEIVQHNLEKGQRELLTDFFQSDGGRVYWQDWVVNYWTLLL